MKRLIWSAVLLAFLAVAAYVGLAHLPAAWDPRVPLRIGDETNLLTRFKLNRASNDDALCQQVLSEANLSYTPIEDEVTQPGCGFRNAVRIDATTAQVTEPFAFSCRAALSLAMWEHHVLQPAAQKHFGAPVTKLEHFGSYACRSVYNRPNARISHHATADALDVAGFVVGEDTRVRVLGDWPGNDRSALFLREVRDGACRFFDSVLSPEYNAAHRDHFHLDRGSFRICR